MFVLFVRFEISSKFEHRQSAQLPVRRLPTTFNVQQYSMSQVLPFDIIALIIDIGGESKDSNLFKNWPLSK